MSPQGKTPVEDMEDIRTVRLFKVSGKSLGIVGGQTWFGPSLPLLRPSCLCIRHCPISMSDVSSRQDTGRRHIISSPIFIGVGYLRYWHQVFETVQRIFVFFCSNHLYRRQVFAKLRSDFFRDLTWCLFTCMVWELKTIEDFNKYGGVLPSPLQ